MNQMMILAVNSITFGGLLFLLSAGFSLIFGLMRIPNLVHGSLFMFGAYISSTLFVRYNVNFWIAALLSAAAIAAFGGLIERFLLRRLAGNNLAQVLVTLGIAFMIADFCLMVWTGDPAQHQPFQRDADDADAQPRDDRHQPEIAAARQQAVAEIRAEHEERAVREIGNAHQPEDQREAGRQQEQQAAEGQTVQCLDDPELS